MSNLPFIEIDAPSLTVMAGESDELINPGTYGKALGLYLQDKLSSLGYSVPCVLCEDWGWYLAADRDSFRMEICVYGIPKDLQHESGSWPEEDEVADEIDSVPQGTQLSLCIHVATQPRKYWNWKQFRFIDRSALVRELNQNILETLESDPEISVIQCCDEFPLG